MIQSLSIQIQTQDYLLETRKHIQAHYRPLDDIDYDTR